MTILEIDRFNFLNTPVEFYQGLVNLKVFDSSTNNFLILDDLMNECKDNEDVENLFTVDSHHKQISLIFVSHNIFTKGKYVRDLSLNSSYLILFYNPRHKVQISTLARQMYPGKCKEFMEIFNDAISRDNGYGYLFLDLNVYTNNDMRIQSNIIWDEINHRILYLMN